MIRKLAFTFGLVVLTAATALSQGRISGTVIDIDANEPIPFANVVVFSGGVQRGIAQTDFNGKYAISPLDAGKYTIKTSYLGEEKEIQGVVVNSNKTTRLDIEFTTSKIIDEVVVYGEKLIEVDQTSVGQEYDAETIEKMATRSVTDVVTMSAGTQSQDDGDRASIGGGRPEGAVIFVNGVKQLSSNVPNLPMNAIKELQLITSGVPAQYGDVTSGVVNIVTKVGAQKFIGGIEAETGNLPFLDDLAPNFQPQGIGLWNQHLLGVNFSGPLKTRTRIDQIDDGNGNVVNDTIKETVLGVFFSGQYQYAKDPRPTVIKDKDGNFQTGIYQVNPDVEADMFQNPLVPSGNGYRYKAETLTFDDLSITKERKNVARNSVLLNSTFEYYPNQNTTFAFGGSVDYRKFHSYIPGYSLMNYNNNPLNTNIDYNLFGRFRQTFGSNAASDSSASLIKNAYYQIQFDYSAERRREEDDTHGDRLFRYGHVGNFDFYDDYVKADDREGGSSPYYYRNVGNTNTVLFSQNGAVLDTLDAVYDGVSVNSSVNDGRYKFTDSEYNPLAARFVSHYNELNGGDPFSLDELLENGLFYNGFRARLVHSLWFGPGREYAGFSKSVREQYRVSGMAGADVGSHNLTFGFEYEQRSRSSYFVSPLDLWSLASTKINTHLSNQFVFGDAGPVNQVVDDNNNVQLDYRRAVIEGAEQTKMDMMIRESQGLAINDEINLYNMNPDDLSVDMFDGNDLIFFGLGNWAGYDYTGQRVRGNVTFQDFFYDSLIRPQAAFTPIYASFYIQDKFEINDLILRLGVRVDRYDANQTVLRDKYSTVYLDKVGETDLSAFANGDLFSDANRSSLIGEDWAIYVDKTSDELNGNQNTYNVVGFRDGNSWYDVNGNRVRDYSTIKALLGDDAPSNARPWFTYAEQLKEPGNAADRRIYDETSLDINGAFQDFRAQWNVMPRISFSFPVNDMATFFANYDVLTQRPNPDRTRIRPSDFYYLRQIQFVNNPDLRPSKQINYQLGFKQALDKKQTIAMTLAASYQERKDEVQFTRVNNAFPGAYATFDNIDFSTVKRGEVSFDTRRINNFKIIASYTISFADGTGSGATTAVNLINSGLGNIRVPSPLDFDQRHAIKMNLDYRLDSGQGPVIMGKKRLANMGATVQMFAGSGLPYSKNRNSATSEVALGIAGRNVLDGGINSSRLPWNNRFSLRVYKDYSVKGRDNALQVYMFVQNLFNTRNVLNVYRNTGSPDDDGFLYSSPGNETFTSATQIDLYLARLAVSENYSLPRRVRFGLTYSF